VALSLTEMGQGIDPDGALIKNCPKCGRLNWSWTLCTHGPRKTTPRPDNAPYVGQEKKDKVRTSKDVDEDEGDTINPNGSPGKRPPSK